MDICCCLVLLNGVCFLRLGVCLCSGCCAFCVIYDACSLSGY